MKTFLLVGSVLGYPILVYAPSEVAAYDVLVADLKERVVVAGLSELGNDDPQTSEVIHLKTSISDSRTKWNSKDISSICRR